MIDLHSHIIPQMPGDDGVENYYDAVCILEDAYKQGLKTIVATPHIKGDITKEFAFILDDKIKKLQKVLSEKDIDITILPGAELFMSESLFDFISDTDLSVNHTGKYVLIEFPMFYVPYFADELLDEYLSKGITPIIAHPERYGFMSEKPNYLFELIERGMLAQMNAESLLGGYGVRIKNVAFEFLKHDLIHFVASDVHHPEWRMWMLDKAYGKLAEIMGKDYAKDLVIENPQRIIDGEDLATYEPIPIDFSIGFAIKNFLFGVYENFVR